MVPFTSRAFPRVSSRCSSFIRQGFTAKEIGRLAGISERTVRWHVSSLMDKLKAADRAQAVARGFELGLLGVSTPPRR